MFFGQQPITPETENGPAPPAWTVASSQHVEMNARSPGGRGSRDLSRAFWTGGSSGEGSVLVSELQWWGRGCPVSSAALWNEVAIKGIIPRTREFAEAETN